MGGLVYIFPGQGSQKVGMGRELCEHSPDALALFQAADAILGTSLSQMCFNGPADTLTDTINAQPAILVASLALLAWAKAAGAPTPLAVAGHSLGHFSALAAAGAIHFADALLLVRARGAAMKAAGQAQPGGMAAVLKLDVATLNEICWQATAQTGQYVGVANDNAPDQIVISGAAAAVERASQLAKEAGAKRVIPLAVSIAAHSPLMQGAVAELERHLAHVPVCTPATPVISNVTAAPMSAPADIKADILRQLTSPVRWTESVQALAAAGGDVFVEIGPGNVLTGLVKRILPAAQAWSLDEPDGLARLLDYAKAQHES